VDHKPLITSHHASPLDQEIPMAPQTPQTLDNHARLFPIYHYVTLPLLLLYFLYAIYDAVFHFGAGTLMAVVVAFALLCLALSARLMALSVQDRVIRLEERLRMRALLPADLHGRIEEFTPKQLVALRFACDDELPALARKVLDDKITDQKAIKQMVKSWRADHLRA
jgi:hypothetical protein